MRKILLVLLLAPLMGISQMKSPVKWVFTSKNISAGVYEIHLTATVDAGWHTYSQTTPDGGPLPTKISFVSNPLIKLNGTVTEVGELHTEHSTIFGVDVKQYSGKVDFVQKIQVKGNAKTTASGKVEFMACDDTQCLPPKTVDFSIPLS